MTLSDFWTSVQWDFKDLGRFECEITRALLSQQHRVQLYYNEKPCAWNASCCFWVSSTAPTFISSHKLSLAVCICKSSFSVGGGDFWQLQMTNSHLYPAALKQTREACLSCLQLSIVSITNTRLLRTVDEEAIGLWFQMKLNLSLCEEAREPAQSLRTTPLAFHENTNVLYILWLYWSCVWKG